MGKILLSGLLGVILMSLLPASVLADEEISISPFMAKSARPHKLTLLNHGLASLEERLQMIERAQKSIEVEYFIYRTDKSSKLFTQALIKKANQGVKIRVLLDYFMVKGELTPFHAHEMEAAGIDVKYFNTTGALNLFSGQYRNHRKLLLIDGKEVLTGGRNIGDEYFDLDSEYNFLDREVRVEGPIVASIRTTFDETFASKLSKQVNRPEMPLRSDFKYSHGENDNESLYEEDLKAWMKNVDKARAFVNNPLDEVTGNSIRQKGKEELELEYTGVCSQMSFNSEYPTIGKKNRKKFRVIKHSLFDRVKATKSSLMIDSPYFIVNDELGSALDIALNKGVDVKVLTNSLNSTDAIYVYAAFDSLALDWLHKGIDSYIFKGNRPDSYSVMTEFAGEADFGVHAKTFIFDKKDVLIGTYNVDPRSANYNSEMVVACENNPELAAAVQTDIDVRLSGSIHLDSKEAIRDAEFYQVGFGKKIPSNIFSYLL